MRHQKIEFEIRNRYNFFLWFFKVGFVFAMVVISILPHVEFGPNDHRKDVPHFSFGMLKDPSSRPSTSFFFKFLEEFLTSLFYRCDNFKKLQVLLLGFFKSGSMMKRNLKIDATDETRLF